MPNRRLHGFLVVGFFLLAGCGFQPVNHFPWWGTGHSTRELEAQLDEANRLFTGGDFEAAENIFQNLQQSENPVMARQALYGLACSRFMTAENREEYLEAVKLLEQWRRIMSVSLNREDPRMLFSLFREVLPTDSEDSSQDASSAEEHFLMRFFDRETKIEALEAYILNLKGRIGELEKQKGAVKEMEASNKAMENALRQKEDAARAMEEELLMLREQLKTLETIDQEIQEKKQGISSP